MSVPASHALDLDALPPAAREAFLVLRAEVAGLRAQTERQDYLIAELRHALYGKRSEQLDSDDRQLAFEDLETAIAEAEVAQDASPARNEGGTRRPAAKRNLGHLPDHLPRIEQVIEPKHKVCPCGCADLVKIGEDRGERLDIIPARFQVIVTIRPRYACRCCKEGVLQADTPARLIEGGMPTEGTLAHIVVSKYADHLPLYRQSQIYARGGVDLDRSTLATWCGKVGFRLAPVVDRMLVHLKRSTRLFMDETRAPVLDPGAGKTKTGYLWALTRDGEPLKAPLVRAQWRTDGVAKILRRSSSPMRPAAAEPMRCTFCRTSTASCRLTDIPGMTLWPTLGASAASR